MCVQFFAGDVDEYDAFDGDDEMKAHSQVKDLLADYFGEGQ